MNTDLTVLKSAYFNAATNDERKRIDHQIRMLRRRLTNRTKKSRKSTRKESWR